jgi:hypothetical protein
MSSKIKEFCWFLYYINNGFVVRFRVIVVDHLFARTTTKVMFWKVLSAGELGTFWPLINCLKLQERLKAFPFSCGVQNKPGVYVRVGLFIPWINETLLADLNSARPMSGPVFTIFLTFLISFFLL